MDFNEVIPALIERIEALEKRVKKLETADDAPKPAAAPKGGKRS